MGEPHFVVKIDQQTCEVVLGPREALDRSQLVTGSVNWLIDPPASEFSGAAQIRYNSSAVPAMVKPQGSERCEVLFQTPASGVAPGQLCVFYDGPRVLGGGWIESADWTGGATRCHSNCVRCC